MTGRVWEIADELATSSGFEPANAEVVSRAIAEGINPTTASVQVGKWKRDRVERHEPGIDRLSKSRTSPSTQPIIESDAPISRWEVLLKNGFSYRADWSVNDKQKITLDRMLPNEPGVYAFVVDEKVVYIGVSTSLSRRMTGYSAGHAGQKTSRRLNEKMIETINAGKTVRVLFASPGTTKWNDLPVEIAQGLEAGLISMFKPEWNMRGLG